MAAVGSVFSPEAEAELRRLQAMAFAIANPTNAPSTDESLSFRAGEEPAMKMALKPSLDRGDVTAALVEVGTALSESLQRLHSAMEDHFVRFFDHLKKRSEDALAVWMPKPDGVTPEKAGMQRNAPPAQQRSKPPNSQMTQAVDALQTWLAIELEAVMTSTHATTGAVYLRSNDSSGYLRRAACIPARCDLPTDVALASGSTIGTVVQSCVGTTVCKSRQDAFEEEARRTGKPAMTSAVKFNVRTAVVLPLVTPSSQTAIGCVVIANKSEPGQYGFTTADEHRVWSFAASCEGVFARYPCNTLLQYAPSRDLATALRTVAHILPVTETGGDPLLVNGVPVPTKAPKMLIVRQGTSGAAQAAKDAHMDVVATAGSKDSAGRRSSTTGISAEAAQPLNDEDVLESVAPYLRNLEMLWHKALESVMGLRAECSRWEDKVSQRDARIIDLEVAMKNLAKQLHRTKADIRRIQRVVPQHLRETLGDDHTQPEFQQSCGSAMMSSTALVRHELAGAPAAARRSAEGNRESSAESTRQPPSALPAISPRGNSKRKAPQTAR